MKISHFSASVYLSIAVLLAACGGGGGGGGTTPSTGATTPAPPAPTITSFSAANSTITAGGSTSLTAVYANGSGNINNQVGTVASGVPVSVSPTATTTYTLTVNNSAGNTVTASTTVSVLPAATPIPLAIGTPDLPYSTALAASSSAYFQITGLTTGHRYTFSVTAANTPTVAYYSDAYTTPIACDPNAAAPCLITAPGNAIWIRVSYSFFGGGTITVNAQHASNPAEFEGDWNAPIPLTYTPGTATHVGKVDKYVSYYDIQGLTIGKTYTVWTQSMTNDVRMGTLDPVAHKWIGGYCSPDNTYLNGPTNPENCTWTATATHLLIGIENTLIANIGSAYILRVEEATTSEGSVAAPVIMNYSAGKAAAAGRVAVGGASYYRVTGLVAGVPYSLNLNGIDRAILTGTSGPPVLQTYANDPTYSTPSTCTQATGAGYEPMQCAFTAAGTDLYFKVVGPAQFGWTYNVSVTPVPVNELNVALSSANLPYTGQTYDISSQYTVSGLLPNTAYQVFLAGITGKVDLFAFGGAATQCMYFARQTTATCFLYSDAAGTLTARATPSNGMFGLGSFYTLDVKPAPLLTTVHQDRSGPIAIQDPTQALLPVTPTSVPIVVTGDPVTSISNVTVELFIRHGYTSQLTIELVAPDGITVVTLAAPSIGSLMYPTSLSGDGVYNLKLNDYASKRIQDGLAPYYGTFRPYTPLHVLNGMNANGTWTLRVKDDQWGNITTQTGEYYAWGITFN